MPLLSAVPDLPVRDVEKSIPFYRDILAFTLCHHDKGFAIFHRDSVELHLWQADDESWQSRGVQAPVRSGAESFIAGIASCRIAVTGINDLYRDLQPQGVIHPNGAIGDGAWGTREFAISDPDNNLITFFERHL
jgi:catechol 2,3-dioxygenase-like lactoylglutathione lyase family enzyme